MESINCSICHLQNRKGMPIVWCPHCSESLCSSCEQHHRVQRLSKDHTTIPYEDYCKLPTFIRDVDLNCQDHNEKYQYFCRSHDVPCCVKCLSSSHKKCDDTPVIDDIIRNVKASAGFEDVWGQLQKTHETYKIAIKTGENNIRDIKTKRNVFATRIEEKTNRLIDQLNTFKTQTLSALNSEVTATISKIETTNQILRLKEIQLKTIVGHKTSIKMNTSNLQAFMGIKHIENEVKESQESFQHMCKDGDLSEYQVTMEEHDIIEDIFHRVKSLGEVKVVKEQATLTLNVDKPNKAQVMVERGFPPQLKLIQQFHIRGVCGGCCTMPNGLMVFAGNTEVKITQSDGSVKSTINVADKIDDVTLIDDKHIAVSNPYVKTISIIDVESNQVIERLQTKNEVRGITHHGGYIYFCVPDIGVKKINITTEIIETVRHDESVDTYSRIYTDGKRLCYTCIFKKTVTVLDSNYEVLFTFNDDKKMGGPRGLSFDKHQNMFVCNYEIDELVLISRDGDKIETLVSGADVIAVHYCVETKSLLIVGENGDIRKYLVK